MATKKYSGIKSSVKKPKSTAKRNAERAERARNSNRRKAYTGLASSVSKRGKQTTVTKKSTRAQKVRQVRIMPLQGQNLVEQLPETALSKKGLTLRQLHRNTPRLMKENGAECTVKKFKRTKTASGLPAVTAVVRHNDPWRPDAVPRDHQVQIIGRVHDTKLSDRKQKVLCSCDCENYVYMWEYANAKYGAARIIYGNGEAPNFTNPGETPGLCKHLVATVDAILSKGA